jgi:hypothetical protein
MRAFSILGRELRLGLADVTAELQSAVEELGFARAGAVFVRSFPADARFADQAAARFELTAERMVLQAARLEPVAWELALELVCDRAADVEWWLVGSAARALRGETVEPRDIDLVTDADGCDRLAAALADLLVEPLVDGGRLGDRWFRAFGEARIECVGGMRVANEGTVVWRGHELRVATVA